MNYVNSSVSHWFVFCEAFYLYRLLQVQAYRDEVRWYILAGWRKSRWKLVDRIEYIRFSSGTFVFNHYYLYDTISFEERSGDMLVWTIILWMDYSWTKCSSADCKSNISIGNWFFFDYWFDFSSIFWFLRIFASYWVANWIKPIKWPTTVNNDDLQNSGKIYSMNSSVNYLHTFSRLTRSTLILLPLFGIHYFLFLWNTKPVLIPSLIVIHLTVHTIFSSLQVEPRAWEEDFLERFSFL